MTLRLRLVSRSFAACWFAFALIIGGVAAQEKPVPLPESEEVAVLTLGQKEIDTFAALALKNGFPARAKQAWLEVLAEYAPDDEAARKALGFAQRNQVWYRDPAFVFPEHDQLDATAARMLEQRWQAVASKLGEAHRGLAVLLATAGKVERAQYHSLRALRFLPTDAKVIAQNGMRQIEGITGDDIDLAVLQRSRMMDRALTRLTEQAFPSTRASEKQPLLDAIGVAYEGVQTEHFTVYGDWDTDVLKRAAEWAERSLAFCTEAFAGIAGFPPKVQSRTLVFFKTKEPWAQLVRKHVRASDAEWLVANVSASEIGIVETAAAVTPELVYDLAVRWIAQDYSGLKADALEEGLGHAIVGMFFGRNLVFSIGRQDPERTVAGSSEQKKLMMPDLDTWKELAIEMAWQRDGTSAARLPLLKAAEFPSDARIKAWSFCDYLLRLDPNLLRQLERTVVKSRSEVDVLAAFAEFAGQPLPPLEARWRRFWTEDSPLRRAVVSKTTPLEAASREAPPWLELFNRLRTQCGQKPVGWSAQLSTACKEHVDYLKANKDQRGPEKEHTQQAGKPGFSNAGHAFAPLAMVWTKDQKKAADSWLLLPGYRDAIVNANIDTVGIYVESGIVVLDAARGRNGKTAVSTQVWPAGDDGQRARAPVPAAVDVELLGPEVQQLLAANQRGKQKQVGFPLTLHTYNGGVTEASVKVTCQGVEVPGFLVRTSGSIRRTSAEGLWVFYPAEPWKRGVDIVAAWQWSRGGKYTVIFLAN